jgi:hypothetical protein
METSLPQLKIDIEPIRLLFTSEPYVVFTKRGYQAAANVFDQKRRTEHFIYLGAQSLAEQLEVLRAHNEGRLRGIEVWIRKKDPTKFAKYYVEE